MDKNKRKNKSILKLSTAELREIRSFHIVIGKYSLFMGIGEIQPRKGVFESVDLEEFKALVKNLVPTTDEQAGRICSIVERLTREHPELKRKIEEWCKIPESDRSKLRKRP